MRQRPPLHPGQPTQGLFVEHDAPDAPECSGVFRKVAHGHGDHGHRGLIGKRNGGCDVAPGKQENQRLAGEAAAQADGGFMLSAAAGETEDQRLGHRVRIDGDVDDLARMGRKKDVAALDERVGLHAPGGAAAALHDLQDAADGHPGVHQLDAHREGLAEPEDASEPRLRPNRHLGRRMSGNEEQQGRENRGQGPHPACGHPLP